MTPKQALNTLLVHALSTVPAPQGQLIYYKKIILKALDTPVADNGKLKELQAELVDRTIRIAELEEELAATAATAAKPRTRKKQNATARTTT
jgi:hypothetical protein